MLLVVVDLVVVPWSVWWEGISGLVTPAAPPPGITATQIGALAGFTALASGLNWYVMGHYRDKGFGMGYRTGYIAGLRGGRREVLAVGVTFPDDERNTALWRRWYRLLMVDMWGVFFVGAMLGMLLPTVLMSHAVALSGQQPTAADGADVRRGHAAPGVRLGDVLPAAADGRAHPVLHPAGDLRGDGSGGHRRGARQRRGCGGSSRATRAGSTTRS